MNFSPGEDAESLRPLARGFLEKQSTEQDVRRHMDTASGYDAEVWTRPAQELGLHGLAIPEEFDGSGAGPVELGVVFEEMGAALYGGPFLSSVALAATALLQIGDHEACADYLPGITTGATAATLAWAGAAPSQSTLAGEPSDHGWRLSGRAPIVFDGADATLVLIAATTPACSASTGMPSSRFAGRSTCPRRTSPPSNSAGRTTC